MLHLIIAAILTLAPTPHLDIVCTIPNNEWAIETMVVMKESYYNREVKGNEELFLLAAESEANKGLTSKNPNLKPTCKARFHESVAHIVEARYWTDAQYSIDPNEEWIVVSHIVLKPPKHNS